MGIQYASVEPAANIIIEVLEDAVFDTVYLIPFLFVTYLAMEWLEHRTGAKTQEAIRRAGVAGPLFGAILGVVPQCGFSAVAATLYAGRVVTIGALFAVLLSTSDEMLPIFIAQQVSLSTILSILGAKIVFAVIVGFAVDGVMRALHRNSETLRIHELCEQDHCHCQQDCETCAHNPRLVYEHFDDCGEDCDHEHHHHDHAHDHDGGWASIVKSALIHTAQVTLFVFIITLVLNAVIEGVGEDVLGDFLSQNAVLSILGATLVGLIPNCAASIVIADLYVEGVLSAGAMFGGLLSAAGVGLIVLFRSNRPMWQNFAIVGALYILGVLGGLIISALGISFV